MAQNEFPNALEQEKALLSAMMQYGEDVIPYVTEIVTAEDFYRPDHRAMFRALVALYERSIVPNVLMLEDELTKRGEIPRIDHKYLYSLLECEYTSTRATYYAENIREKAIRRRLIEVGNEIADEASDAHKELLEVLGDAEQKILSVTSRTQQTGFELIKDIGFRSFERIQYIHNRHGEIYGVPTGFHDLDRHTNGYQKSDMIILAARPSMGKTALALNMALGAAMRGKIVAIFSLEMSKMQLYNRLLSLDSGVNSQFLNTGDLSRSDLLAIADAMERLAELKLYIDDTAGISLLELRSKARQLKHTPGLDLIIIDYLQLMTGGRQENRQQEISEISRNLKALARELDVPILALSQLSRSVELRAEKKPQLSDLRESGSLEQDADIVMFLYRDEYYNRDDVDNQNLAELIIAKNRNGPTCSLMMQFNKEIMRFGDLTRRES